MRTFREEPLDHFIFLSGEHIHGMIAEFIRYHNGARSSQVIHAIIRGRDAREPTADSDESDNLGEELCHR